MAASDLTLSGFVIFTFVVLYTFNLIVIGMQRIKDNWPEYRCQPLVMPFASYFGHNTSLNFAYCVQTMQKNYMKDLLQPINFNIHALNDITNGLSKSMNDTRAFTNYFRVSGIAAFQNIFSTAFNIMVEIQRTTINIKDVIQKMIGIMTTNLYLLNGSIMTMDSAWSGPPGQLVRALCFHPQTKLKLQKGEMVAMKDIPLDSILSNGTRVCAIMQISNLDENGDIIEKMYKVKRSNSTDNMAVGACDHILVSGSHLIFDPARKQFVHVKDLPMAEISEVDCAVLSCLITSDHTIPIGDWIFHDWEDNNGSESKSI